MLVKTTDGTPDAVKVACPVWSGGKSGDNFKGLPITIFRGVQIDEKEYLWYLLRIRCVPFFMLSGLALTKLKKVSAGLFLGWTGISVGVLVSLAASNLGMKGCLLCLIGVSPQFLFYIPAYFMILKYCYESEDGRWNRQKTIFVGLMMSLGIITELYVNPVLVKLFLNYV